MKSFFRDISSSVGRIILFLILAMSFMNVALGQSPESLFEDGNEAYSAGEFVKAQNFYEQSMALDVGRQFPQNKFNLANALFQQKKYDEAAKQYQSFIAQTPSASWKEQAYYNLANTFFATQDYNAAINAYQEALRINPKDEDARYNLALTLQLTGRSSGKATSNSSQKNKANRPKTRPLTEEEKRQLLQHLSQLENQTIQNLDQSKAVAKKKSVKDW